MKESYTQDEVIEMVNQVQSVYIDAVCDVIQDSHPQQTLEIAVKSMTNLMNLTKQWEEKYN